LIPIIGSIVLIVIYLVLLFGSKTAPSLKNRIIASLIWVGIALAVFAVLMMTGLFAYLAETAVRQIS
jgi:hypothetical protein